MHGGRRVRTGKERLADVAYVGATILMVVAGAILAAMGRFESALVWTAAVMAVLVLVAERLLGLRVGDDGILERMDTRHSVVEQLDRPEEEGVLEELDKSSEVRVLPIDATVRLVRPDGREDTPRDP